MTASGWVTVVVVGLVVGWLIEQYAVSKKYPGGWWLSLIVGLVGAWIGAAYLGSWLWMLGGANVIGSILVAAVLSYVVGLFGSEAKV